MLLLLEQSFGDTLFGADLEPELRCKKSTGLYFVATPKKRVTCFSSFTLGVGFLGPIFVPAFVRRLSSAEKRMLKSCLIM